jgi:cyclopropane-fatty-acyl-phospholipid synthase
MNKNLSLIFQSLEKISSGSITIYLPNGEEKKFDSNQKGVLADITIKNFDFFSDLITGGDVALGESYINNDWTSSDLAALLTFFTENAKVLEDFFHTKKLQAIWLYIANLFKKNTKKGSKKNIKAHYDLGNDFYQLWLDETLTYSSGLFLKNDETLAEAQRNKYQNILAKLNTGSILEIGCGWGGFAEIAIRNNYQNNHQLTCLTISNKQAEFFKKRLASEIEAKKIELKLQDYRLEKNIYDNVVSIEMFEAVGKEYWAKYFEVVANSLKKNGKAILQIITIDEVVFKDYINRVDFIQKHIFPGGILPSKTKIRELARQHGFEIKSETCFGLDYAKTLSIWLKNFDLVKSEIIALGFSEEFIRKWRFYLCYCVAGFKSQRTDVVQFELSRI